MCSYFVSHHAPQKLPRRRFFCELLSHPAPCPCPTHPSLKQCTRRESQPQPAKQQPSGESDHDLGDFSLLLTRKLLKCRYLGRAQDVSIMPYSQSLALSIRGTIFRLTENSAKGGCCRFLSTAPMRRSTSSSTVLVSKMAPNTLMSCGTVCAGYAHISIC